MIRSANEPCIVFVANRGYALTSSRASLIKHFIDSGWSVVIATSEDKESLALVDAGVRIERVLFNRGGASVAADVIAYRRLLKIYSEWQPCVVHHFNAKPVILGSLAARRALGSSVVVLNTITGLGHAFVRGGFVARLAGAGYGLALPRADATIFQNRDDRALFLKRGWLSESNCRLVVGSGVDMGRFVLPMPQPAANRLTVIMLGRLIWQKGVHEFASVARSMCQRYPQVRFVWAGEIDPGHPDAVPQSWLDEQTAFEYVGRVSDVPDRLQNAYLMLFPSYREGVPRAVMEAAASGVPVVAFDVPGVREAVRHEETGLLVPDRGVDALTEAVERLLADKPLRERMGAAARRLAEAEFDIRSIQAQHLALYRELGVDIAAE
ncbi:glycosyltransferase family 4 protein [Salinisphaera aquimarina]